MSACSKQYQSLNDLHRQHKEYLYVEGDSADMKNLEELWNTAQTLVEKRSRGIEEQNAVEEFEQRTSLLEFHISDQVYNFTNFYPG